MILLQIKDNQPHKLRVRVVDSLDKVLPSIVVSLCDGDCSFDEGLCPMCSNFYQSAKTRIRDWHIKENIKQKELSMEKEKDSIPELIVALILLPLVMLFKLIALALILLFVASPLILIAWIFAR